LIIPLSYVITDVRERALSSFNERGQAHFERREIPEAIRYFLKAVQSGENPASHAFERWACWMFLGEYEEAWKESDLAGASFKGWPALHQRVLIRCLRGLGDGIQFLRYARLLRRHCDRITVQAPPQLLRLCDFIPGIDEAVPLDYTSIPPKYDFEIECSDLPYLFRTTLANIPFREGYICAPVERPDAKSDCLRVGIVWAAGEWNPVRSIPLSLLEPLTEISGLKLVSLQKGPEVTQFKDFGRRESIADLGSALNDIVDTMTAIAQLDLVISVDTMVAHLAGAMGKPVWVLLGNAADWRWMLDRSDTPWYRSMRLFRQSATADWKIVIRDLIDALQILYRARTSPFLETLRC
jgi:hypothetical protein